MKNLAQRRWLAVVIAAMAVGCTSVQSVQHDPANHRRSITASAYSLDGCQANLDELAGGSVQMTGHVQEVLQSILNFGVSPFYRCWGVIDDPKT